MIAHRLTTVRDCDVHLHARAGPGGRQGQLRRAGRPQPELPGDGGRRPRMSPAPVLAIVAPSFNQVSETFVADHVRELAPGATVLICQDGRDAERFGLPVLADLDSESASGRRDRLAARLRRRAGFGPILARPDRERLAAFLRAAGRRRGAGGVRQHRHHGRRGLRRARPAARRLLPRPRRDAAQAPRLDGAALPPAVRPGAGPRRRVALHRRRAPGDRLPGGARRGDLERRRPGALPAGSPGARAHPRGWTARRDEGAASDASGFRRGGAGLPAGAPRPRRRRPAARPLRGGDRRGTASAAG